MKNICIVASLLLMATLVLVVGMTTSNLAAKNGNPNPGVAPPHSTVRGMTYGEWRQTALEYLFRTPAEISPEWDLTGEASDAHQSKDMFFLMGPRDVDVYRSVKPGARIWIPTGGRAAMWSLVEVPAKAYAASLGMDPNTLSEAELMSLFANHLCDGIQGRYVSVNGEPLPYVEDYVDETPPFQLWILPGPFLPLQGWMGTTVAVGGAVIIGPLPKGEYLIESGNTSGDAWYWNVTVE